MSVSNILSQKSLDQVWRSVHSCVAARYWLWSTVLWSPKFQSKWENWVWCTILLVADPLRRLLKMGPEWLGWRFKITISFRDRRVQSSMHFCNCICEGNRTAQKSENSLLLSGRENQLCLFVDSWDTVCSSSRIKEKHNVFVRKPVYRTGKCRDVEFWRVYPERVLKCVKLIMLIYRVEEYQQISIQRASNNNSSNPESHIDLVIRF